MTHPEVRVPVQVLRLLVALVWDPVMNRLTRLSIQKFRNVAPTTRELRPGLNVVLGKNAAR